MPDPTIYNMGERLVWEERQRVLRAIEQAKGLWSNKFGEWVASELNSLLGLGLKFDQNGDLGKMLDSLNSMYLEAIERGEVSGTGRTDWGHRVSALQAPALKSSS